MSYCGIIDAKTRKATRCNKFSSHKNRCNKHKKITYLLLKYSKMDEYWLSCNCNIC